MEEATMQQELALPASYEQRMTPMQIKRVNELKASIDMHDKSKVLAFGREEQAHISKFSDSVLEGTSTKEIGEAGTLLVKVVGDIRGFGADCEKENSGFLAFLKKQKSKIQNMQTKYKSLAANMENVEQELQAKYNKLLEVSRNFDTMYANNEETYKFLTMLIFAGEQALQEEKAKLQQMQQEAQESGDQMEIQKVSDFANDIRSFESRLYDLKLSRYIAIQQAPQIRNIQKGADDTSKGIIRAITTSIPLWKNQMAMAVGMQAVRESLDVLNAVDDATNAMLIANSQMNKQLTLETARAAQRGVVDIETINTVNQDLIEALSGSYEIAQQAVTARAEGAKQLQANEAQLREAVVRYSNLS